MLKGQWASLNREHSCSAVSVYSCVGLLEAPFYVNPLPVHLASLRKIVGRVLLLFSKEMVMMGQ